MHKVLGFIMNLVNYVSEISLFHWSLIPLLVSPPTLSRLLSLSHVSWPPAQTPRRGQRGNWFRHLPGKSFQALTSWDQANFKVRRPHHISCFPLQCQFFSTCLHALRVLTNCSSSPYRQPDSCLFSCMENSSGVPSHSISVPNLPSSCWRKLKWRGGQPQGIQA